MWGIVSIVFGIIELTIGLRFLFLLLGVSSDSTLVNWIYNVSHPLIAPFGKLFGHTLSAIPGTLSGSYFEPASLVALVIYGVIGGIVLRLLTRPSSRA
jgi:hypothetical protein